MSEGKLCVKCSRKSLGEPDTLLAMDKCHGLMVYPTDHICLWSEPICTPPSFKVFVPPLQTCDYPHICKMPYDCALMT